MRVLSLHQHLPAPSRVIVRVEVQQLDFRTGKEQTYIEQVFYATSGEIRVTHDPDAGTLAVSG